MTLPEILKLPRLQRGSTIGVIAPSGKIIDKDLFHKGIEILHELGFVTRFPERLWPGFDLFADSDPERSREFNRMWQDPAIDAIMAARGGYGCIRMAEGISIDLLRHVPKLLIGFSDITVLHSLVNNRAGRASFHGPVVTSLPRMTREGIRALQSILKGEPLEWKKMGRIEILRGQEHLQGVATGGNLSTIVSTVGTSFDFSWKDKIVFLEDTSEPFYKIDRMLTQLRLSGKILEPTAIILGNFSCGLNLDRQESIVLHENIWQRVLELTDYRTTVWGNFPIGHGPINVTIPFGVAIHLDGNSSELFFP